LKVQTKYANTSQIPFLAYSGGHGVIAGLDSVQNGIQISLLKLDSVEISEKLHQTLFAASGQKELHAYANYASSSETREICTVVRHGDYRNQSHSKRSMTQKENPTIMPLSCNRLSGLQVRR